MRLGSLSLLISLLLWNVPVWAAPQVFFCGVASTTIPSTSATSYQALCRASSTWASSDDATEASSKLVASGSGTVGNLRLQLTTAPGGVAQWDFTVRSNGNDTVVGC